MNNSKAIHLLGCCMISCGVSLASSVPAQTAVVAAPIQAVVVAASTTNAAQQAAPSSTTQHGSQPAQHGFQPVQQSLIRATARRGFSLQPDMPALLTDRPTVPADRSQLTFTLPGVQDVED